MFKGARESVLLVGEPAVLGGPWGRRSARMTVLGFLGMETRIWNHVRYEVRQTAGRGVMAGDEVGL